MKSRPEKRGQRWSTAGGRELRLKARPPARFSSLLVIKEPTTIKDKETKTTVPSGNSYFWHIESPSNRLSGNSYFWRTATAVHPRVVGKSAGLPSRVVAKPSGWNKV